MDKQARAPRVSHTSDAAVHLGGELILCRTWNISTSGMSLVCPFHRKTSRPVTVEFFLTQETGWLRAEAQLVRAESFVGGYLWGIKFADLDQNVAASIEGHVLCRLVQATVQPSETDPVPGMT